MLWRASSSPQHCRAHISNLACIPLANKSFHHAIHITLHILSALLFNRLHTQLIDGRAHRWIQLPRHTLNEPLIRFQLCLPFICSASNKPCHLSIHSTHTASSAYRIKNCAVNRKHKTSSRELIGVCTHCNSRKLHHHAKRCSLCTLNRIMNRVAVFKHRRRYTLPAYSAA